MGEGEGTMGQSGATSRRSGGGLAPTWQRIKDIWDRVPFVQFFLFFLLEVLLFFYALKSKG